MEIKKKIIRKNYKEIGIILILNLLAITVNVISHCSGYLKFANFDYQAFLAWNYAAFTDLVPYRDLYYPYGLLSYYKDSNIFFLLLYIFLSLITINLLIFTLIQIFRNKFIAYFTIIMFFAFTILISNFSTLNRYGISTVFALTISYIFYKGVNSRKFYFVSGLMLSSIFWLVHDQGIFGLIIFVFFYLFRKVSEYKNKEKTNLLKSVLNDSLYFLTGFLVGLIPFIIYLTKNSALTDFWYFLTVSLPEFPVMSKTPFFNLFFSVNNIFTVGVLSLSILFLVYKLLNKEKIALFTYTEISLTLTLLLLEQKNIVRLMEHAITFVAFILFAIILWEVLKLKIITEKTKKKIYLMTLFLILIFFYFPYGNRSGINSASDLKIKPLNCYASNINKAKNLDEYQRVVEGLSKYKNFNNKIFSFPGDPIFYILLNQKLPFYPSVYEASSEKSQFQVIKYLKNEDIKYVVINSENKSIQDEVPNYIRATYELRYILNNYVFRDKIGKFLILEKKENTDFFTKLNDPLVAEYQKFLLNINLESVPYSEGLHKNKIITDKKNKFLTEDLSQAKTNEYLKNNKTNSSNLFLLIKNKSSNDYYSLKFRTVDGFETNVKMKSCKENYCIVNLSRLPLFYKMREIQSIRSKDEILVSILMPSNDNITKLW